jgi:hypothetical protein
VHFGKVRQVIVYGGGPDTSGTQPVRTFDRCTLFGEGFTHAVIGHFRGTDQPAMLGLHSGYSTKIDGATFFMHQLPLFEVDSGRIADSAWNVVDTWAMNPPVMIALTDAFAVDLDHDGADELIVVAGGARRNGVGSARGEVWIYRGGANFQVDTPAVVIRDDEENNGYGFNVRIADFDGDHQFDLLTGAIYNSTGAKLKFFWGPAWFSSTNASPDRTITLSTNGHPRIGYGVTTLDCDGDNVGDLFQPGPDGKVYLYRMGIASKDARTRALDLADADAVFSKQGFIVTGQLGYVNDSLHRYQMAALFGPSQFNSASEEVLGLGGSSTGPDTSYEAYYDGTLDGLIEGSVFSRGGPIPDVNGDGWDDYIAADPEWYNYTGTGNSPGIAMILAGGPYIPRDSATLGVRDIAIAGRERAVSVWPNPVHDELNIAWRGDLKQMPARFEVHDITGRLVASGNVTPQLGAALWRCGDVSVGTYLLTAFDRTGSVITTTQVVKQ